MIEKVVIKDNKNAALKYLHELDNFKNGTEYTFKTGVNVIVGENGSGKTTLLNLIRHYAMVDEIECGKGMYNSNVSKLFGLKDSFLDGVDVYGDYDKNIFRLCHATERTNDGVMKDFTSFGTFIEQRHSSTGEGVNIALNSLFQYIFSRKVNLKYDYNQFDKLWPQYVEYINSHRVECADEWTIMMDEPDRNLDVDNMQQILSVLSFHKEQTQIIAVVHNPLLICALSKNPEVNVIEMTRGYVKKVVSLVNEFVK
jgi:predicted ATPase